jgi:hypothetical protein
LDIVFRTLHPQVPSFQNAASETLRVTWTPPIAGETAQGLLAKHLRAILGFGESPESSN